MVQMDAQYEEALEARRQQLAEQAQAAAASPPDSHPTASHDAQRDSEAGSQVGYGTIVAPGPKAYPHPVMVVPSTLVVL